MFIGVLAAPIFYEHITCHMDPSGNSTKNWLKGLIAPDWNCAIMCQGGGEGGVISSCHPYEMDELRRVFGWPVRYDTLLGALHTIL
jgi:hypothetical protein